MSYRKPHCECSEDNCQSYSSYIRVKKKWIKAGEYNSKCRTFTPTKDVKTYSEIKQEAFDKMIEEKLPYLKKLVGW